MMSQLIVNRKRKSKHILSQQKVRKNLTFAQKREICEKYHKNPKHSQTDLAIEYCVRQSTISDILSNEEKWFSIDIASPEARKKKTCQTRYRNNDSQLLEENWHSSCRY
jgi:hypothetical protein